MFIDELSDSHHKWVNTTLNIMDSDMKPSIADSDTSKNYDFGQTKDICVRPILLPMITSHHVMTETSCQKFKNNFHTYSTKKISCRLIVLFLLICCLLTSLLLVYMTHFYLKSYITQNWDEKMIQLEIPLNKIECHFKKCLLYVFI